MCVSPHSFLFFLFFAPAACLFKTIYFLNCSCSLPLARGGKIYQNVYCDTKTSQSVWLFLAIYISVMFANFTFCLAFILKTPIFSSHCSEIRNRVRQQIHFLVSGPCSPAPTLFPRRYCEPNCPLFVSLSFSPLYLQPCGRCRHCAPPSLTRHHLAKPYPILHLSSIYYSVSSTLATTLVTFSWASLPHPDSPAKDSVILTHLIKPES